MMCERMSLRRLLLSVLLLACMLPLAGAGLSVTASPITFFALDMQDPSVPDGLYGQIGITTACSSHVEITLTAIPQLTPSLLGAGAMGLRVGYDLIGGVPDTFFHLIIDAGALVVIDHAAGELSPLIEFHISPLAFGSRDYGYRDRLFTMGVLYDLHRSSWTLSWSTMTGEWYL